MTLADIFSEIGVAKDQLYSSFQNLLSYMYNEVHFGWYIAIFVAFGIYLSIKEWLEEHQSVQIFLIKLLRWFFIAFGALIGICIVAGFIIIIIYG